MKTAIYREYLLADQLTGRISVTCCNDLFSALFTSFARKCSPCVIASLLHGFQSFNFLISLLRIRFFSLSL
jgi:hypothetical protein